jgi:hypothetical protein
MRQANCFIVFCAAIGAFVANNCSVVHAQKAVVPDGANSAGLVLKVVPSSAIKIGARLQVTVSSRQRGYLILLAVDAAGDARQIFPAIAGDSLPPGATDETNAVKPGQPITLPNKANPLSNFELTANASGTSAVVALLSPIPVQLISLSELGGASDALTGVQSVFDMVKELRVAPRDERAALAAPQWSMAAATYEVE